MRRIWYTPEFPASAPTLAAAEAAGATEIVQSAEQAGYVEVPEFGDQLAERQQQAHQSLAQRRYAASQSFAYSLQGQLFQLPCDIQAASNVLGAIVGLQLANSPGPITWKLAEGVFRDLTYQDLIALGQAMRAHVQTCYNLESKYADEIGAAKEPAGVDVSQGWPTS